MSRQRDTDGAMPKDGNEGISPPIDEVAEAEVVDSSPAGPDVLGFSLPDDPEAAVTLLLDEVARARAGAAAHLDDLQRLAAEFENYRKRMLREQTQQVERASERVMSSMLPVLDSFDLALAHEPSSPSEKKLLDGVQRTHRLLLEVLGREGLEPIPALGQSFDPKLHEAVSATEETSGQPLVVTEELRPGYRLRGRVIRPALVAVGPEDEGAA